MQRSLKFFLMFTAIFIISCTHVDRPAPGILRPSQADISSYNTALWEGDTAMVWNRLVHTSPSKLTAWQSLADDSIKTAWLELALLNKQNNLSTRQLARELLVWRSRHPAHPANKLFPDNQMLNTLANTTPPRHIAILLPQGGPYDASSQTVREGFLNAYYANQKEVGQQSVKFYDTRAAKSIAGLYQQAVQDGADFIIGPLMKDNVQELRKTRNFNVPTLALNYSDMIWSNAPHNFYEFGLSPEDEAEQIAERAHHAGKNKAIIIAPRSGWGKRMTMALSNHWKSLGGNVQDSFFYEQKSNFNTDIAKLMNVNTAEDKILMHEMNDKTLLEQQRRQDFDVIFLFASPDTARIIVPLLKYYYANDIPIYATSAIYAGKANPTKDTDLNGVFVCDIPWKRLRQPENNAQDRLYAVGQDAYLLSQALSRLVLLPNFPVYGTTGALILAPTNQIHRRLPCNRINNGLL